MHRKQQRFPAVAVGEQTPSMPATSADPSHLDDYVGAAAEGTRRLATAAGELRTALDALRASEGRAAFLADVPEVDLDLTFLGRRWEGVATWLDGVSRAFAAADTGSGGPLTLDDTVLAVGPGRWAPPEVDALVRDGRVIVDTGSGDDTVRVLDGPDGLVVVVNGRSYRFASGEVLLRTGTGDDSVGDAPLVTPPTGDGFAVDGGAGDDLLVVSGGAAVVSGGRGNDTIRGGAGDDRLLGGEGDDRIEGGAGEDRAIGGDGDDVIDGHGGDDWITGGAGDDLLYGEDGDDLLLGGDGRDHVDGGAGDDTIGGDAGADVLSGGMDDDVVDGGQGADVVYAGPGDDHVRGGAGADDLHVEPGDVVADAARSDEVWEVPVDVTLLADITIEAPSRPVYERILSDLVTLASTVAGARLLDGLRGVAITVAAHHPDPETDAGMPTDAYYPDIDLVLYRRDDDEAGFAADPGSALAYSPLVSLHHELAHAYDDAHGTAVEGAYLGDDVEQIPTDVREDGRIRVLDRDRDGRVSPDELREVLDDDDDGRLSDDELDLDGDGEIDAGDGWVTNRERVTVGLPIDHDHNPTTPDVPAGEVGRGPGLDENTLRHELGVPRRDAY